MKGARVKGHDIVPTEGANGNDVTYYACNNPACKIAASTLEEAKEKALLEKCPVEGDR